MRNEAGRRDSSPPLPLLVLLAGVVFATLAAPPSVAEDAKPFYLRPLGELYLPFDTYTAPLTGQSKPLYSTFGYGTGLALDWGLLPWLRPFARGTYVLLPYAGGASLQVAEGDLGLGFLLAASDRLRLRLDAMGGLAQLYTPGITGLAWSAGGRLGVEYRLAPSLTLSARGGWSSLLGASQPIVSAAAGGLALSWDLSALGGAGAGVGIQAERLDAIFPSLYSWYDDNPFGSVRLSNAEDATIRDVKLTFNSPRYMDQPKLCATIPALKAGASVSVPLSALFNDSLLDNTQGIEARGELVVEYDYLGSKRVERSPLDFRIHHRNAITWSDDRRAASFVSPTNPAALWFSRFASGIVRDRLRGDINKPLQYAIGMFEAERLYGLNYVVVPANDYAVKHELKDYIDSVQFPHQTLANRGGDCSDLAILFATLMQSVGVEAAFITIPGHIFAAFDSGLGEEEGKAAFSDPGLLILREGRAWIPVEITMVRDGFMKAWRVGAKEWSDNARAGTAAFYRLPDCWKAYPSAAVPGVNPRFVLPDSAETALAFDTSLDRFVSREVAPAALALGSELSSSPARVRDNELGILYAGWGMLKEAWKRYSASAQAGLQQAWTNLGNVAYIRKDWKLALTYFTYARGLDAGDSNALLGIARAQYELENFAASDAAYAELRARDPALAQRFGYLGSIFGGEGRAWSLADRFGSTTWATMRKKAESPVLVAAAQPDAKAQASRGGEPDPLLLPKAKPPKATTKAAPVTAPPAAAAASALPSAPPAQAAAAASPRKLSRPLLQPLPDEAASPLPETSPQPVLAAVPVAAPFPALAAASPQPGPAPATPASPAPASPAPAPQPVAAPEPVAASVPAPTPAPVPAPAPIPEPAPEPAAAPPPAPQILASTPEPLAPPPETAPQAPALAEATAVPPPSVVPIEAPVAMAAPPEVPAQAQPIPEPTSVAKVPAVAPEPRPLAELAPVPASAPAALPEPAPAPQPAPPPGPVPEPAPAIAEEPPEEIELARVAAQRPPAAPSETQAPEPPTSSALPPPPPAIAAEPPRDLDVAQVIVPRPAPAIAAEPPRDLDVAPPARPPSAPALAALTPSLQPPLGEPGPSAQATAVKVPSPPAPLAQEGGGAASPAPTAPPESPLQAPSVQVEELSPAATPALPEPSPIVEPIAVAQAPVQPIHVPEPVASPEPRPEAQPTLPPEAAPAQPEGNVELASAAPTEPEPVEPLPPPEPTARPVLEAVAEPGPAQASPPAPVAPPTPEPAAEPAPELAAASVPEPAATASAAPAPEPVAQPAAEPATEPEAPPAAMQGTALALAAPASKKEPRASPPTPIVAAAPSLAGFASAKPGLGTWSFDSKTARQEDAEQFFAKLLLDKAPQAAAFKLSFSARSQGRGWVGLGVHILVDKARTHKGFGEGESWLIWLTRDPVHYTQDPVRIQIYRSRGDVDMVLVAEAPAPLSIFEFNRFDISADPAAGTIGVSINGEALLSYDAGDALGEGAVLALRTLDRAEFKELLAEEGK